MDYRVKRVREVPLENLVKQVLLVPLVSLDIRVMPVKKAHKDRLVPKASKVPLVHPDCQVSPANEVSRDYQVCPDLKEKWVLLDQLALQETKVSKANLEKKDPLVLKEEQVNRELLDLRVPKVTPETLEFPVQLEEMDFRDNAVCQVHQDPWVRRVKTVTRENQANPVRKDLKEEKEILDLLVQTAIPVYAEKWDLSVHPEKGDPLVTLDDEVAKERTDLKALVDHLVLLVIKVFPARVELKERRVILVKRDQSDLLVPPVNKELLVQKVFKVYLAPRDQKVLKDLRVKLEILDHQVLLVKMELTVNVDQLDLKAKKANQVYKAHPDREVSLVPKDPKEALAIQASLDRMARLVSKDQRENQAKMVWTAKRAKRVFQEKPVLRAKWVCQAHRASLDRKVLPVFKATLANLVTRVTSAFRAYLDPRVRQEIRVFTAHKDLQDSEDLPDPRVTLDLQANPAKPVILDPMVKLV